MNIIVELTKEEIDLAIVEYLNSKGLGFNDRPIVYNTTDINNISCTVKAKLIRDTGLPVDNKKEV